MRILDAQVGALAHPVTLDALADVLDLFAAAETEYLCKLPKYSRRGADAQLRQSL